MAITLPLWGLLSVEAQSDCPHKEAVYCPVIEAPMVAELRKGTVRIKYTVGTSGAVNAIAVLGFEGDARWVDAVINTVSKWRYKPSAEAYEQEFSFRAEWQEWKAD